MTRFQLRQDQIARFHQDGYLIVERLFDEEEIALLYKIAKADRALAAETHSARDAKGGESKLALRNHLSEDDIYSAVVRCDRVRGTMETLLGDEVYHFHHKMMVKEPRVGGAWEWHQDYGYWYKNNHCLYPDMGSCMIAVDRASRENGCLQVLGGSHKCGRLEHGTAGAQAGADLERVGELKKRLPLVYVELEPGSAVFFHANLLHGSDPNRSPNPRWTLICCYNTRHNDPFKPSGHPSYHPLECLDDEQVRVIGRQQLERMQQTV